MKRKKKDKDKEPYNLSKESARTGSNFGKANKAASLVKKTFEPLTKKYGDDEVFVRLRTLMTRIMNSAPNELGHNAQITDGFLSQLRINFNKERELNNLINFRPQAEIKNAESIIIHLPEMIPEKAFHYSGKATSAVISFVCGIMHFDLNKGSYSSTKEFEIPLNGEFFSKKKLTFPLQHAENSAVSLAMCTYHKSNGIQMTGNRWKAAAIINTWHLVDGVVKNFVPTKPWVKSVPDVKNVEGSVDWEEG